MFIGQTSRKAFLPVHIARNPVDAERDTKHLHLGREMAAARENCTGRNARACPWSGALGVPEGLGGEEHILTAAYVYFFFTMVCLFALCSRGVVAAALRCAFAFCCCCSLLLLRAFIYR